MPLQHRHGYAADLHRGLPTGDIARPRSSSHQPSVRVRAAIQPSSARFELVALLRGVQPLVPHVRLSVSLAERGPSGSAGPPRRCQGRFRPHPHLGISRVGPADCSAGPPSELLVRLSPQAAQASRVGDSGVKCCIPALTE
jgi:hypothetical protein